MLTLGSRFSWPLITWVKGDPAICTNPVRHSQTQNLFRIPLVSYGSRVLGHGVAPLVVSDVPLNGAVWAYELEQSQPWIP